ncbi:MAG: hypothetical protein ACR2RE_12805, partial [Geminicoccaceae bacterium]
YETGRPHPDEAPRLLAERLIDELYFSDTDTLLLPSRGGAQQSSGAQLQPRSETELPSLDAVRPSSDVIRELFSNSDALITISKARTLLTTDPALSVRLFRSLMQGLCDIDKKDERKRALIWVVDFGLRDDRPSSLATFLNCISLATQFRAIGIFSPKGQLALWGDLLQRVIVVVGSLHDYEIDQCYREAGVDIPETTPSMYSVVGDRLFLEGLPHRWTGIGQYAEIFGLNQHNVWGHPTITAHLSLDDWDVSSSNEVDSGVDPRNDLRYFYHAPLPLAANVAHCVELGQPGLRWSDGFRTACGAAFSRLGWKDKWIDPVVDPTEAMALLRRDGFAALTLRDFVRLTNNLIDANLEVG